MKTLRFFHPRASLVAFCCVLGLRAAAPAGESLPTAAEIKTAFDAMDTSRNGAIGASEWDHASFALFRSFDKNNDDVIDREELKATSIAPDTFRRIDLDQDDRVNVGEFNDLRRALFQIADIDRNEFVDRVEYELFVIMERTGWQDRNQNGRVELSELSATLQKSFEVLDRDNDGRLQPEEAAFMRPAAFKRYDTDRDGHLSRDEFLAGYRSEMLGT